MRPIFLLLLTVISISASAQTYSETILYNFGSTSVSDGAGPNGLVIDSAGNLYGTTGGGGGSVNCFSGCGIVYKLTPSGKETILHIFTGKTDGAYPYAALAIDKSNNLYGTTNAGGLGYGTVFKITAAGKYSILHKFGRVAGDGTYPVGPVTLDSAGNIYGATPSGGNSGCNCGTVYKLTAKGVESILYQFLGGSDGSHPQANVLTDGKGNLYGTTSTSSNGNGVMWKLNSKNAESVLYAPPTSDQGSQLNYLVRDSAGKFYTELNGTDQDFNQYGGIVQTNGVVSTFYEFYYFFNSCPLPLPIGPLRIVGGTLYGTEYIGGAYSVCDENDGIYLNGGGDVYSFTPPGTGEDWSYSFPDPSSGSTTDGWYPVGGAVTDSAGNVYSTTGAGGFYGKGIVVKLTKN